MKRKWRLVSAVKPKAPKFRKRSPSCSLENWWFKGTLNQFGLSVAISKEATAVNVKMLLPECGGRSKLPLWYWFSPCTKPSSLRPASEVHVPAAKTLLCFWGLHVQYFSRTGEKSWAQGTIWAFKMEEQDGANICKTIFFSNSCTVFSYLVL